MMLVLLSGCATTQDFMQRHPKTTAVIAGSVITSLALSRGHRAHGYEMSEPLIATPSVDCSTGGCK